MNETDVNTWLLMIVTAAVAAALIITFRQWLIYERERRIGRIRNTPGQGPVPLDGRTDSLQSMNDGLRREAWLANRRADELAKSLAAARHISRAQERVGLALSTMRVEAEQTGQMPAIAATNSTIEAIEADATKVLEDTKVVPMTARRRRVLAS
jgi:hypothetical protein